MCIEWRESRITTRFRGIITSCWHAIPKERPRFKDVLDMVKPNLELSKRINNSVVSQYRLNSLSALTSLASFPHRDMWSAPRPVVFCSSWLHWPWLLHAWGIPVSAILALLSTNSSPIFTLWFQSPQKLLRCTLGCEQLQRGCFSANMLSRSWHFSHGRPGSLCVFQYATR